MFPFSNAIQVFELACNFNGSCVFVIISWNMGDDDYR